MKKQEKTKTSFVSTIYKYLILILPLALFFSYYPVISLGANSSMNFELSIPLIWLVAFDAVGIVYAFERRVLFNGFLRKWAWLLFPVWGTLTVIWSVNMIRGVLTIGILWLICLAGYITWQLRDVFDETFRIKFWKWFFGATILACGWCVLQCILDLAGAPQDYSLMCDGCTYQMFGFPHPNGFAIEPQFMGNLLLAPVLVLVWLMLQKKQEYFALKTLGVLLLIVVTVLFLTFSRGAIYASVVGLCFVSAFQLFGERKNQRRFIIKRLGMVWGLVIISFVLSLNIQGLMAMVSPTNDTYVSGVTKVLNHLSLGIIDIRESKKDDSLPVEKPVENFLEEENNSVFDGYVAESTDTRVRLTDAALKIWSSSPTTLLFGVGLGGAGQALYDNDLSPVPKEIVQNEYASLLLETGLIGFSLFVLLIVLIIRLAWLYPIRVMILGLMVTYGVSLFFFSGLPNALQIYLTPMVLITVYCNSIVFRKKLVS